MVKNITFLEYIKLPLKEMSYLYILFIFIQIASKWVFSSLKEWEWRTVPLNHRWAKYSLKAKSRSQLVFVIKFYWKMMKFICLHIVCGCFRATTARLNTCDRDRMACKDWNIYYLVLHRKIWDSCSKQFIKTEMLVGIHFNNILESHYIEDFPNKQNSCVKTIFGL